MKKLFLAVILSMLFVPLLASAAIVKCQGPTDCDFNMLLYMIGDIYSFIVTKIATPLAVLAVMVGGIIMMTSAGNPNQMSLGKQIFWAAIIGLVLVYCSFFIINLILTAMGSSVKI